ncbi:YraN family protein [Corynebacterium sp. UMB9976]|uniref:YraN family protein n=1 Tax=Corynebacterium TaxID=1716 RepID=UPI0011EB628C|nr:MULTISPECIES: YraN family protein [Corynebacterium]MDK6301259.1 YraN family protein [Corynebacterium sp. UMB9976]TYT20637.1 YraN family protein [Corynebacterium urealyticum]
MDSATQVAQVGRNVTGRGSVRQGAVGRGSVGQCSVGPSTADSTVGVGRQGENLAGEYLVNQGWRIVERNWHCRFAELDIIALDPAGEMVFVEVKYRKDTAHGTGVEAVTQTKLRRMRLAAGKWLAEQQRGVDVVRFDVIDVGPAGVREHVVGVA